MLGSNLVIVISVVVFISAVSVLNFVQPEKLKNQEVKSAQVVVKIDTESNSTANPTPSPTPTIAPSNASPSPTTFPTATPKPTVKPTDGNPTLEINYFVYPGATSLSSNENSLNLESSDNPDSITNWYKDKIRSLGMNAKSFVTTKTNGNVLNKLVGSDRGNEVSVEITKKSEEQNTKIIILIY